MSVAPARIVIDWSTPFDFTYERLPTGDDEAVRYLVPEHLVGEYELALRKMRAAHYALWNFINGCPECEVDPADGFTSI